MKCSKCQNIATHHKITEINGERFEEHLCSKCARESGAGFNNLFSAHEFFNNFLEPFQEKPKRLYCEDCLTTFDDFLETGFVGCEHCYDYFKDQMDDVLKNIQAGVQHKDKLNINQNNSNTLTKKQQLEETLKKAVEEERYEDAARIKKQILELSQKGEN